VIRLEFDVAVAVLLSVLVLLIFGVWLRGRGRYAAQMEDDQAGDVQQCPYCRRLCVDDEHKKFMICPVCKSYFDEEV
jgi:hypothetical protein